jgi:histone H3/H4
MGAPLKVRGTGNYGIETATVQRILRKVAEDSTMDPKRRETLIKALNTAVGLFNEDTADGVMSESTRKPANRPRLVSAPKSARAK